MLKPFLASERSPTLHHHHTKKSIGDPVSFHMLYLQLYKMLKFSFHIRTHINIYIFNFVSIPITIFHIFLQKNYFNTKNSIKYTKLNGVFYIFFSFLLTFFIKFIENQTYYLKSLILIIEFIS